MLNCKICQSSAVRDYRFPFPLVKPLSYEIIRDPSATVFCCLDCGAIFRPVKDANYYQEEEDIDNEDSVVTVYAPEYGGYVSNHFYMGQLLTGLINLSNPSVLDIGCGNGKFLGELSHRFPRYRLSGYDPEVALTKHFKSSKHINYYHGELEDIPHEYDLICFIDSLSYIDDISSLFAFLDSHISPDGQIFITSPDVSRNNMTLLVDGQSYFFTAANLSSIFSKFGYQLDLIDVSKVFPGTYLVLQRNAVEVQPRRSIMIRY